MGNATTGLFAAAYPSDAERSGNVDSALVLKGDSNSAVLSMTVRLNGAGSSWWLKGGSIIFTDLDGSLANDWSETLQFAFLDPSVIVTYNEMFVQYDAVNFIAYGLQEVTPESNQANVRVDFGSALFDASRFTLAMQTHPLAPPTPTPPPPAPAADMGVYIESIGVYEYVTDAPCDPAPTWDIGEAPQCRCNTKEWLCTHADEVCADPTCFVVHTDFEGSILAGVTVPSSCIWIKVKLARIVI